MLVINYQLFTIFILEVPFKEIFWSAPCTHIYPFFAASNDAYFFVDPKPLNRSFYPYQIKVT
jgi:hypothetical protein